jgi:hypothetical protein
MSFERRKASPRHLDLETALDAAEEAAVNGLLLELASALELLAALGPGVRAAPGAPGDRHGLGEHLGLDPEHLGDPLGAVAQTALAIKWASFGNRARAAAIERFSADACARVHLEAYEYVLRNRGRARTVSGAAR